jgi:LysM repeat protein
MKMNAITSGICIALGMALGAGCACATPAQDQSKAGAVTPVPTDVATVEPTMVPTDQPTEEPTEEPTPVPEVLVKPAPEWSSYSVKGGDSLWSIAGQSDVLGDSMLWPILFKANRDQITDPDLIQADQVLKFPTNPTDAQKDEAVREAEETPLYVPHTEPRKTLPMYD